MAAGLKHNFADCEIRSARLPLTHFLELPPEPARVGEEQLAEADHDRSTERVEQVRLVANRYIAVDVFHLRPAIEDVVDPELDLGSAEPLMFHRDLRNVARIGEQPEIERRERGEMQVVAGERVHGRPAPKIAYEPGAKAIVEIACLRLDIVARCAAAIPSSIAVEIIDDGEAWSDIHLIDKGDRVGERECQTPAIAPAEKAASATAEATTATTAEAT